MYSAHTGEKGQGTRTWPSSGSQKKDLCFCWNSSTEEPQHRLSTMKVQPSQTPEQQGTSASLDMLGLWREMKVTGIQGNLLRQSRDAQL